MELYEFEKKNRKLSEMISNGNVRRCNKLEI